MKAKQIVVKRIKGTEGPVLAEPLGSKQVVISKIEHVGDAISGGVTFKLAKIREKADLAGDVDVCLCVAKARCINASQDASIFFWNDSYWMLGVDKLGVSYYRDQAYALYEVELENPEFMETLGGL